MTAPAGIPEEAKKVLIPAVEKSINHPELKNKIENRGYIVDYKSPAELNKIIAKDYETIRALAVRLGLANKTLPSSLSCPPELEQRRACLLSRQAQAGDG